MRNMNAFRPAPRTMSISSPADVFRRDEVDADEWMKTSVSLRRDTRRRAKQYAIDHDMKLQEVVDAALRAYMDGSR